MAMRLQRGREPRRHVDRPSTASLRRSDVPFPLRLVHVEQRAAEVDVGPFQRDHFAGAQSRIASEQHRDQRALIHVSGTSTRRS